MRTLILEHPRLPSAEHFNDIANTPLWSCLMAGYVGAALQEAGLSAQIMDARTHSFAACRDAVLEADPDLLLVHAVYFWEGTRELFAFLQGLKDAGLRAPICLLGFYPSLVWDDVLAAYGQVDCIAVGEPEATAVELARALERGAPLDLAGLALRRNGRPMLDRLRSPHEDLDALAHPLRPFLEHEDTVSILASRGCYNACDFCLIPALGQRRNPWRGRSAKAITTEIAGLAAKGKDDLYFVDPNFIGPGQRGRQRIMELADRLAGLDITWGMECRASDLTPGLMHAMARSGLTSLLMGLESGSQNALDRMGKNSTPAQNLAAIAQVRDAGLEPEVGFIMFEPRASLEDIGRNLGFLQKARLLDRLGRTANLLYHDQIALKGTGLYAKALQAGGLQPQGLLGFQGRLIYDDARVAWLAGVMRRLCLLVLRDMGRAASGIHWSAETSREPYASLNALLPRQFKRLLHLARSWSGAPKANQARHAQEQAESEILELLS